MGFIGKWLARIGNVGETARSVGLGWKSIQAQKPGIKPQEIAELYVRIRYGATNEPELAKQVLSDLKGEDITPLNLAWIVLSVENDLTGRQDGVEVNGKKCTEWQSVMREELQKMGL